MPMGYMTLDSDSIPQWGANINKYCPRCCRVAKHELLGVFGSYPSIHKGVRGNRYIAQYSCLTDDCGQKVEIEEFAPGEWQSLPMFADKNDYD